MDTAIIMFAQNIFGRAPALDMVAIFCASILIWAMVATVIVFWVVDKAKRMTAVIAAFVSAAAAWLVNQGIGELVFRPRPFAVNDSVRLLIEKSALEKSFPSDHAAAAFALAFAVFMIDRRWGWVFIALASVVSIGRVLVGVHYPSDVLAGAFVGIVCAFITHRLIHKFLRTKHHA